MADKIQLRRDTAANWTSENPILAEGELGLELDTKKIKMGDGVTSWNSLSYNWSLNAVLPSQTTHAGKYLTTDGSDPSWGALGSMASQNSSNVSITGGIITGIQDLAVADGGTGASNPSDARTNLGLGTIATQNANSVVITGGSITGVSITNSIAGNAATATKLQTPRLIGGVSFDGSADINLPGVNIAGNQNTTGNAATATKLQTPKFIGGVSFDGSADINLPGVNTAGNQSTTGNAATATRLQTPRLIGGVSFDGSANINLPGVNIAGNQNTSGNAATATKLQTSRLIGGVSFDGSASINLPGVNIAGNQNTSGNAATATYATSAGSLSGYNMGNRDLTISTSSPSGGSNGDVWFLYY